MPVDDAVTSAPDVRAPRRWPTDPGRSRPHPRGRAAAGKRRRSTRGPSVVACPPSRSSTWMRRRSMTRPDERDRGPVVVDHGELLARRHLDDTVGQGPAAVPGDPDGEHLVAVTVDHLEDRAGGQAGDLVLGRPTSEQQQHAGHGTPFRSRSSRARSRGPGGSARAVGAGSLVVVGRHPTRARRPDDRGCRAGKVRREPSRVGSQEHTGAVSPREP
jgi:hypothetical protein